MAVVVVGSANVDLVTCAPRFARPGETLLGSRFEQLFGGKGANQAVAAALLGSRVSMVAKVGADSLGASTLGNFASFGVDAAHVAQTKSAASGIAHIVVDGAGENQIIIVAGANGELAPADVDDADAAIAGARVVLTQLEVPLATTMRALERGRHAGALTVFNAAPAPTEPLPDALFALCDVVCPNETETAILTGLKTETDEECVVAARAILAKGAKNVVLTLGARGCCLVRAGETVWVPVPAGFEAAAVADTTGAGDAFLGALAHGVAAGASLADALPGAVAVASRSVLKRGAQASYPALDELPAGTVRRATVDAAAAPPRPPTPPRAAAADAAAEAAAAETVDGLVGDGMILGVGTGKTVELCLRRIADKLERGALKDVLCLPTSDATARLLETLKLPTLRHDSDASVDLAIGGCDAVDGQKHVLKGGKGAMLREKLLRDAAKAWVVCCAEGKVCDAVGSTYPIPVEIAPAYHQRTLRKLANLPSLQPAVARLRVGAAPAGFPGCAMPGDDGAAVYKTDNGNLIVDLFLEAPLRDVRRAADDLSRTAGVVEHGLLPADENPPIVVVGRADGTATRL